MPVKHYIVVLAALSVVAGVAGCGSQAQRESQAPPAPTTTASSQPTAGSTTATPKLPSQSASQLVKEVMKGHGGTSERQSPAEKRAEKKLEEKVAREAATVPNGPPIHEQTNPQVREKEARQQVEAIEEYKRLKGEGK
jgi:hypothetical protein